MTLTQAHYINNTDAHFCWKWNYRNFTTIFLLYLSCIVVLSVPILFNMCNCIMIITITTWLLSVPIYARLSTTTSLSISVCTWRNYYVCCMIFTLAWWRHQMETFSALLAICAGNSPVPGEFPAQRPVTRSFDVYFDLRPNKRLSKQ